MTLYLNVKNKEIQLSPWNYSFINPIYNYVDTDLNEIESIQASGTELDFIRRSFSNIPISNTTTCIWYGEMAKFIAMNIKLIIG